MGHCVKQCSRGLWGGAIADARELVCTCSRFVNMWSVLSMRMVSLGVGTPWSCGRCPPTTIPGNRFPTSSSRSLSGGQSHNRARLARFLPYHDCPLCHDSRYANVGLFYLQQGFFAMYDMKVHTSQGEHVHPTHQTRHFTDASTTSRRIQRRKTTRPSGMSCAKASRS